MIQEISDTQFESEVLLSEQPVLVDFVADWCAPCKQLAAIVEEVSQELSGKLKVVKVDVDKSPMVAQALRVQSLPTLMLVHQGQLAGQLAGVVPKQAILDMVKPALPSDASEIKPQELAAALQTGQVLPVDLRDAHAYGRYRIPGAVNLPKEELDARAAELMPQDGRLRVLYARSTDDAKEAAQTLRSKGIQVGFLEGGFLHWESDGLDVEKG